MKLLLLVFAALGFLVTPASGGWTGCTGNLPGHCKVQCSSLERAMFMCDRYRPCCVRDSSIPVPPPVQINKPSTKREKERPGEVLLNN
uniref:Beta-defensin n=2 Tax=Equus TaxID=9789 RepID=A0A3Q2GVE3_HORSE